MLNNFNWVLKLLLRDGTLFDWRQDSKKIFPNLLFNCYITTVNGTGPQNEQPLSYGKSGEIYSRLWRCCRARGSSVKALPGGPSKVGSCKFCFFS